MARNKFVEGKAGMKVEKKSKRKNSEVQ